MPKLYPCIEPLTGKRQAIVYERRTKKEHAMFLKGLVACHLEAVKIRLVQNNLNTHNANSFYEHLSARQAFALSQRFEFYYTPEAASCLNMIEIELFYC